MKKKRKAKVTRNRNMMNKYSKGKPKSQIEFLS